MSGTLGVKELRSGIWEQESGRPGQSDRVLCLQGVSWYVCKMEKLEKMWLTVFWVSVLISETLEKLIKILNKAK